MEDIKMLTDSQFYIDTVSKNKLITYKALKYNTKHKGYELYNKYEKLKLGVLLCYFLNTDFHSFEDNNLDLYIKLTMISILKKTDEHEKN